MKYYCDTISVPLAEKLKEKGMPLGSYVYTPNGMVARKDEANLAYFDDQLVPYCDYASTFDWLLNLGYDVEVYLSMTKRSKADGTTQRLYAWIVNAPEQVNEATSRDEEYYTWHEAANAAIEKAITLI